MRYDIGLQTVAAGSVWICWRLTRTEGGGGRGGGEGGGKGGKVTSPAPHFLFVDSSCATVFFVRGRPTTPHLSSA